MYHLNSPRPSPLNSFPSPGREQDVPSPLLTSRELETHPATVTPKPNSSPFVNIRPLAPPNPLAPLVTPKGRAFDAPLPFQPQHRHHQHHPRQQFQQQEQHQQIHQLQPMRATPSPTKLEQRTASLSEVQQQHNEEKNDMKQQQHLMDVSKGSTGLSPTPISEPAAAAPVRENTGRWAAPEHKLFLQGLEKYGKGWKKIAALIKTRSVVQVRTHAQKYFQKLAKAEQKQQKEQQQQQQQQDQQFSEGGARSVKRKEPSSMTTPMVPTLTEPTFPSLPNKKARQVSVSLNPEPLHPGAYMHRQSGIIPLHSTAAPSVSSSSLGNAGVPHRVSSSSLTSEDVPKLDESLLYLLDDGTSFDPDPVPLAATDSQRSSQPANQPSSDSGSVVDSSPIMSSFSPLSGISKGRQHQLGSNGTAFMDHHDKEFKGSNEMDTLLDLCDPLDWLTDMSMKESFQLPSPEDPAIVPKSVDIGLESSGMQLSANRIACVNANVLLECDEF